MNRIRRNILKGLGLMPLMLTTSWIKGKPITISKPRVRFSVNAYSFNDELRNGTMTLGDMMDFAADIGLDAVDLTGYYFAGYPGIPPDQVLYKLKRKALKLGLDISWTGVRNNFVNPDAEARKSDLDIIRSWMVVSAKLGAPIMRIFAGKGEHEGFTKDQVKEWLVEELKICAQYGAENGVLPVLQHHNDFLFTSDEVIDILKRVDSYWLGLILDIGSLRQGNPYEEIAKLAPYADYWFIKEFVYRNGQSESVNMNKLSKIIYRTGYSGYVSFESLSEGDPKEIIAQMYTSFKDAFETSIESNN